VTSASQRGVTPLLAGTWLLICLRMRRLINQIDALSTAKRGGKARTGHGGKKSSKVIFYLAWPLMLFVFGAMTVQALVNLHLALDPAETFWRTVEFSPSLIVGVAFLLLLLWFSSLMLNAASGELAKPDWDLEWLITLPIRSDTLLWARILERSVVQPSGVLQIYMACVVIAWFSGLRWLAPLAGVLAAWPLMFLGAVARTLIDTGLRLSLQPAQLRNLHAVLSVLSIITLYLAFSLGLPGKADFMLGIAAAMPDWLRYTPMGLAALALNERDIGKQFGCYLLLLLETGLLGWLGVLLLRHQLRHGVISGSSRDSSRGTQAPPDAGPEKPPLIPMTAVQRRELTLLSRDRNFMVQSLVLPLLIVGAQLLLGSSSMASDMWTNPNVLASVAFGLAAYSLSMSAFQTLNTEGHALWLLYTFPHSIEAVLRDKAKLWGALTLAYPLVLFSIGAFLAPAIDWKFVGAMLTALLGIPIYAFIAVALGVFGSNPLEQQQNQKVKPAYIYLYMTLAGLYVYAVVTPDLVQRLVFMTLTLMLAFALWQKARDQLPYLLDPDASPPPRVSLSDGLIAAMVFFVIQAVVVAGFMTAVSRGDRVHGAAVLMAFSIAGGLTYLLMRSVYAKAKTADVPRILGAANQPLLGIAAGLVTGLAALCYLYVINTTGLLDSARNNNALTFLGWWALPLALIAAPLFEEFIFRGLIFGGLRRSFGLWPAALASAAIFAILHPAISLLPVFIMGVAAALVYDRTRSLLAPMLTHVGYNACVIGAQWLIL
jgi:membrane protease YdiL (CAAX protease family)